MPRKTASADVISAISCTGEVADALAHAAPGDRENLVDHYVCWGEQSVGVAGLQGVADERAVRL